MGWTSLIPWRLLGVVALVLGVLGGAWYWLHSFGEGRYQDGRAEVQLEVDRLTEQHNADARRQEQAQQEKVNAVDTKYQDQVAVTTAALATARAESDAAVAVGNRLRGTLQAIRAELQAAKGGNAASRSDGAAETLGQLLETCTDLVERNQGVAVASAAEAERLADQLRSLQSYAAEVSAAPASAPN